MPRGSRAGFPARGAPRRQTIWKLAEPRLAGARPVRVIDWLGLNLIRVPAALPEVSFLSVVRSATVLCDSLIVSRTGSNPAIVSLPKPRLVKSKRVGVFGSAV